MFDRYYTGLYRTSQFDKSGHVQIRYMLLRQKLPLKQKAFSSFYVSRIHFDNYKYETNQLNWTAI